MKQIRKQIAQLMVSMNRINCCYSVCCQAFNLKDSEFGLLYSLADGVPYSQKQICDEWGIPRTTLNTIIKEWKARGLVQLEPIPGKRREMNIILTPSGQELVDKVLKKVFDMENAAMEETIREFSPDFIRAVRYYEARLREHGEKIFGIASPAPVSPKE